MRQMSFALTTEQMIARTKTVTRRRGWATLAPGTVLRAIEKGQGLKKGEKVRKLGLIRVASVRREMLAEILFNDGDVYREGFPHMTAEQFVEMFCEHNGCSADAPVTRIEFEHIEETP